jgi:hypothetical protein
MITLTTPKTVSINGSVVESNTQGAMDLLDYDFLSNVATLRFDIGSGAPANWNIGVYNDPIKMTVNMTTGVWSAVDANGATVGSGTFSGSGFANFQQQFKAIRNSAEQFAATAFMPGTQVPWT